MRKTTLLLLISCFTLVIACKEDTPATGYQATRTLAPETLGDSSAYLVADSVIYDVLLQNPDSTDEWANHCLRKLDRNTIADMVFDGIYSGKLKAYKYTTDEAMSIDDVKAMEEREGYERHKIAKMQFEEQWFIDQKSMKISKKVIAIMLAYEIKASENRYRAGVKVRIP